MLTLKPLPLNGGAMNPVLVDDGNEMLLIDCGLDGSFETICETAGLKGMDISRLTKIIITHQDHDHMGGLPAFIKAFPNVQVIASEIEKDYIEGTRKIIRLEQAEAELAGAAPEEIAAITARIDARKSQFTPGRVDIAVKDGDRFDWCGGVRIIGTPGHMPGHIAVYIEEFKTLVTGDALTAANGMLKSANPAYTLDMKQAAESAGKLLALDITEIICYHGGIVGGDCHGALKAAIAAWPV